MSEKQILNLGCGLRPHADAINHDRVRHHDHVDIAHDLNVLPWPWENDRFERVLAIAVLEHLHIDRLAIMNELWRITRPDGMAIIKLPYWNSDISYQDMTHYWFASLKTMDQLDPRTKRGQMYRFYTPYKWYIIDAKFQNRHKSSILFELQKVVHGES